jgi:1-acyl-sn-glycerol-3-phosphate acyltransferase
MLRWLLLVLVHLFSIPLGSAAALALKLVRPDFPSVERIGRWWSGCALWACGAQLRLEELDRLERARPCVVVCNHTSALDIYVATRYLPIPYRIPAKASLFRIPFFGWAIGKGGVAVPLDRTGGRRDQQMVDRLADELNQNAVVLFYAEGTRSRSGRLQRLKKGAFVTAIREQVPLVPMVIAGAHQVHPTAKPIVRSGEVVVRVLEPIDTRGMDLDDRHDLVERTRRAMSAALPRDQRPRDLEPGGSGVEHAEEPREPARSRRTGTG